LARSSRDVPASGVAARTRYPRPFLRLGAAGARAWARAVRELARRGDLDPNRLVQLQLYGHLTDLCAVYPAAMRVLGALADAEDHLPGWRQLRADMATELGLAPELTVIRTTCRRPRRIPRGPHGRTPEGTAA
jgi:hypothetical protein